jgi:hypothetical protein
MRRGRTKALPLLCAAVVVFGGSVLCGSVPRAGAASSAPTAAASATPSGPASAPDSAPTDTSPGSMPPTAGPTLNPADPAWPGKTVDITGTGWIPGPCEIFSDPTLELQVAANCGVTDAGALSAELVLSPAVSEGSYVIGACQGCRDIAASTKFGTTGRRPPSITLVVGAVPSSSSPASTPPSSPAGTAVTVTATRTASVVVITPSKPAGSPSQAGTVRVPDLLGDRPADARDALARAGLELGFVRPARGTVVQEIPVAGSLVAAHSLVVVSFAVPAAASASFPYWLLASLLAVLLLLGGAAALRTARHRPRRPAPARPDVSVRVVASETDRSRCALQHDGPVYRLDLRPVAGRVTTQFRFLARRTP